MQSTQTLDCHRVTWKVEGDMVSIQFWTVDPKFGMETIQHQVMLFKPDDTSFSFPMCRFKPKSGEWKDYFVVMQTEEKENATTDSTEGTEAQPEQCQAS